jgi:hypothetical protein
MKRRDLFKKLGAAVAAAVVAPAVLAQKKDWPTLLKENGAEEWGVRAGDLTTGTLYPLGTTPPKWRQCYVFEKREFLDGPISMLIKTRRHNHQRWMRCINADDLTDYVDIAIGNGSGMEERQIVLENADFLGGNWVCTIFGGGRKRVEYDYYYLYFRDELGIFIDEPNYQEQNTVRSEAFPEYKYWFIGQNRRGDFIRVDRRTNKMMVEETKEERQARHDRWMKEHGTTNIIEV